MKTRKITEVIFKEVPWNRKEGVKDLYSPNEEFLLKKSYIEVPKGTVIKISETNEPADAYEEYEVILGHDIVVEMTEATKVTVVKKLDEHPL